MSLISVGELDGRLREPGMVVVDCRWALNKPDHGRSAYEAGHIPGAVFGDLETDLAGTGAGRHPLPEPADFDLTLGSWGVDPDSTVVAYDDAGGSIAARLWWMLTDQGHEDTHVLDGGIPAWVDAGLPVEKGEPSNLPRQQADIATGAWTGVVGISEVANRPPDTVVVDARAPERYRGETEPIDARAGHIPGAINLPTSGNLSNGQFLDPDTLRDRYTQAGLDKSEAIMHCGSGVTACHNVLAMELAGLDRPLLYVGSWSDWASTDRPAATGDSPE